MRMGEVPTPPVTDFPRCIDCRWFDPAGWSTCGHPNLGLSFLSGMIYRQPVVVLRDASSLLCGMEGKWFEQKPKSPYATDDSILRAQSRVMEPNT